MKLYTLIFSLFILITHTKAQNTQVFHNADSTNNRVSKLILDKSNQQLYSISWHLTLDTLGEPIYYKLNKIDSNGHLISSKNLFKNGSPTNLETTDITDDTHLLFIQKTDSSTKSYISYIGNNMLFDSFRIKETIPLAFIERYCMRNDSVFILVRDNLNGLGKIYLYISDKNGNYLTHQRIKYEVIQDQRNIIQVTPLCMIDDGQGGFIVAGTRDSSEAKQHIFGISIHGDITWKYIETRIGGSFIKGMQLLPDKTILAYGAFGDYMYMAKFSQQGQLLSENFYYPGGFSDRRSGSCNIINVKIIDEYIYAVGGSHNKFNALNTYTDLGTLLKTDLSGNPIWAKQFGNYYGYNFLDQIYQTSNSRLLLAGFCVDSTQLPLHGVSWFVSTDTAANENLPWCQLVTAQKYYPFTGVHKIDDFSNAIQAYPNPTSGSLTLTNPLQLFISQINIYDASGTLCKTQTINETQHQLDFNITSLKQGLYYIKINTAKGVVVKKIMKQE